MMLDVLETMYFITVIIFVNRLKETRIELLLFRQIYAINY